VVHGRPQTPKNTSFLGSPNPKGSYSPYILGDTTRPGHVTCPSLIQIGSKTAEKNSAQTNKQTDRQTNRHYENNGHLAVNQFTWIDNTMGLCYTVCKMSAVHCLTELEFCWEFMNKSVIKVAENICGKKTTS